MSKQLTTEQSAAIISTLKDRFAQNSHRHPNISWEKVQEKLEHHTDKLWTLQQMEATDGEPDVVGYDNATDSYIFYDCATESPKARRSFCYDQQALDSRKENKPKGSAVGAATEMGATLLTEQQYRELQAMGPFDLKTSSWVLTPPAMRKLGGALFCDRRFDTVFAYHNGAESYYAGRGFRCVILV